MHLQIVVPRVENFSWQSIILVGVSTQARRQDTRLTPDLAARGLKKTLLV